MMFKGMLSIRSALVLCIIFPDVTLGFFCSPILSPGGIGRTSQARRIPRPAVAALTNDNIITTDAAIDDSDAIQSKIQVYDSVISPLTCQIMHCLLVEQSYRSDGDTVIFQRPDDDTMEKDAEQPPLTQLEWCIHRLLTEIGDTSRTVEYWSRDEFMNIPAHVDIDENRFNDNISSTSSIASSGGASDDMESRNIFCPTTSHVLYLDVQEDVRGPTCIFPGKQGGWTKASATPNNNKSVDLVTVPAVPGRLLRFPGNAVHAVPCPTERWLMTDEDEEALQQKEQDEEEECDDGEDEYGTDEEWDEDDDDEEEEDDYVVERSVLLFNTWPDDAPPPRGVSGDEGDTSMEDWQEDYGVNAERISCNPRSDWQQQDIVATRKQKDEDQAAAKSNTATIRVNLMGPPERRIHKETTARLQQPCADQLKNLKDALQHKTEVTHSQLLEEE